MMRARASATQVPKHARFGLHIVI
eukprot:COSAG04_NODE_16356_length_502_cov_0.508685_2_plen_23_part_01